jgi:hypothetical protein
VGVGRRRRRAVRDHPRADHRRDRGRLDTDDVLGPTEGAAAAVKAALLIALVAACADDGVVMTPVIDLPANDSASAFPLDQLNVEVAHDGDTLDLSSAKFSKGQTVQVGGVPYANDIVVHLTGFVGSSEVAYGRSCAVAVTTDAPIPEPHLYFSRSVKFGQIQTTLPTEVRVGGVAVTYHDGSGLLLGGEDPNTHQPATTIERFDPRTGELRVLATFSGSDPPRLNTVAAALGIGGDAQIAVIGGLDTTTGAGAQFVDLIEADQPDGRRVTQVSDTNMSRVGLTATTLSDGRVIVMGGRPPPSGAPVGEVDEVSAESGTAVVRVTRAMLQFPRYGHTATRLSDDVGASVLVVGGIDASQTPIRIAELYKPLAEGFSTTTYTSPIERSQHQAIRMPDGSVLVLGGYNSMGQGVLALELFTLDGGFQQIGMLPPTAGIVDFSATTLPDGRVLITGGLDSSGNPTNLAFIASLDPLNGAVDVIATDKLAQPRAGHQATLLCDGTVLISGGTSEQVPPERYNPPPDGRR